MARRRFLLMTAGAALLVSLLSGATVGAHGNAVNIALTCITPNPARPLTKVCTAFLKYTDGDPVSRARFQMTAQREGASEAALPPVIFRPLDREGVYSATITFPAYGRWRMKFQVREPGSGEAELLDELLPPLPGVAPEVRARLQVVFTFGLADARNLVVRVIHFLASASWFALVFLVLALSLLLTPEQRWRPLARVARAFPWTAGGSLMLVAMSGIYNALYNVPTRAPGIFAPRVLASLPFGEAYLAAFFVKMGLMLAILVATTLLALALRRVYGQPAPIGGGTVHGPGMSRADPERTVRWLAAFNLLLGLLTFADVVVLGYLHIITHVGGAAGAR